mgnify:CR=1 FL=1
MDIVLGIYSFTLPKYPPQKTISKNASLLEQLGLTAFKLFSNYKMALFFLFSMLLGAALQLTNMYGDTFLDDFKKVAAYGAAAKGNTLLNYCGIKNDLVQFVVDANPHKQNKFLPASHIPVMSEEQLKNSRPDFVIILPWNLKKEITEQLEYIKEWGGKFVVAIPELEIF